MNGPKTPHVVFVAGLSGSGKSTAMAALEDLGFYCVDNLPAQLVAQFIGLCALSNPPVEKIALALDTREERFLTKFPAVAASLRGAGGADRGALPGLLERSDRKALQGDT